MKLACPRCHDKLSIDDNRVPAPGAWARCPKCRERFYIILPLAASEPAVNGPNISSGPLKAETSLNGPAFTLDQITVFPQEDRQYSLISSLIIAALFILIIGAVLLITSAGEQKRWDKQLASVFTAHDYGPDDLKEDLRFLKRKTSTQHHLDYNVPHSGPEHRIFQYYLAHLNNETCQGLKRLEIKSELPQEGLTLSAACSDRDSYAPAIFIKWERAAAVVEPHEGGQPVIISLK